MKKGCPAGPRLIGDCAILTREMRPLSCFEAGPGSFTQTQSSAKTCSLPPAAFLSRRELVKEKTRRAANRKRNGKRSDASKWMSGYAHFRPGNRERKAPEARRSGTQSPRQAARPEAVTQKRLTKRLLREERPRPRKTRQRRQEKGSRQKHAAASEKTAFFS